MSDSNDTGRIKGWVERQTPIFLILLGIVSICVTIWIIKDKIMSTANGSDFHWNLAIEKSIYTVLSILAALAGIVFLLNGLFPRKSRQACDEISARKICLRNLETLANEIAAIFHSEKDAAEKLLRTQGLLKQASELHDPQKRLERVDTHIKFEFELTAARVTYLAISESFLFGACASAHSNDFAYSHLGKLMIVLPIVGIVLALAVLAAVICATSMIFKLKAVREELEGGNPQVHHDIGWRSLEHFVGLLPPFLIPAAFFAAWMYVAFAK